MPFSCEPDRAGPLWALAVLFLEVPLPCKFADFLRTTGFFQVPRTQARGWVF